MGLKYTRSHRRQTVVGFAGDSPPLGSNGYTSKFHVITESCTSLRAFPEKLWLVVPIWFRSRCRQTVEALALISYRLAKVATGQKDYDCGGMPIELGFALETH